ncbi:glyoxal reductase [Candidatus Nomurabacteria bacterium RIFCSPLOWO2_01_FULL_40_15]|uniref:Glyoxal reductase n=1 Tax=Candidatus Nomurabacteria bacterium RIFCSPLOWO2_01_FULL_40_15 TaxID=1801772 RepID=A0A1F6X9W2_9BACT|nr:MAG: glyoxal reductase [Candidatus Nomurabacteria bacterium RIFCSPLOWO2_01_FULL_40_15]
MNKLNLNSKIILNNGLKMPIIGFGTYKITEGEDIEHAVKSALDVGYRLIDTAKIYRNEEGVGRAIKESGIKREEIFITTKLWNPDQGYESALRAIDESLAKLGLSYVDLYLVHWPTASEDVSVSLNKREETWRAMEEIYKSGKAKAVGVSNYTITHLEEMKKYATILPAVNQVEFHPFLYQEELLNYCQQNDIILNAYRPITNGKKLNNKIIEDIAKKHDKSSAQVLLRWSLQHGCIAIPKSVHKNHIKENLNIFDFELSREDMEKLDTLNENLHLSPDPNNIS